MGPTSRRCLSRPRPAPGRAASRCTPPWPPHSRTSSHCSPPRVSRTRQPPPVGTAACPTLTQCGGGGCRGAVSQPHTDSVGWWLQGRLWTGSTKRSGPRCTSQPSPRASRPRRRSTSSSTSGPGSRPSTVRGPKPPIRDTSHRRHPLTGAPYLRSCTIAGAEVTALYGSISEGRLENCRALLARGADPNTVRGPATHRPFVARNPCSTPSVRRRRRRPQRRPQRQRQRL